MELCKQSVRGVDRRIQIGLTINVAGYLFAAETVCQDLQRMCMSYDMPKAAQLFYFAEYTSLMLKSY